MITGVQIDTMVQDPFNFLGPVRVRTALSLLNGFKGMQHNQACISLPIYAHHGTKDKLASLPVGSLQDAHAGFTVRSADDAP